MLTGLQPEILNEQQKTWFAVAVCHAIVADGNIDPSELSYLEQALSCLLYTSPSPRDRQKSRMPSSA